MANEKPKPFPPLQTFKFWTAKIKFDEPDIPLPPQNFTCKVDDFSLDMVSISEGSFNMGNDSYSEKDPDGNPIPPEKRYLYPYFSAAIPPHHVNVPRFFLGKYVVTQKQWRVISALPSIDRGIAPDPSSFKGDDRPVEQVSWLDAMEFCKRLRYLTGKNYRLPSEAEWEYACRAKTTTPFYFGKTITTELVNYNTGNGGGEKELYPGETKTVGLYPANGFGLYDMHGNVWEWCEDSWHDNYLNAPKDGTAWDGKDSPKGMQKVIRGGAWSYDYLSCSSASRNFCEKDKSSYSVGFRVACSV